VTSIAKASPRERLLRAAADLFYREGVASVGVEKLCQTAGVSKRSMYQLFETKDDVVAESLRQFGPHTVAGYFPDEAADLTPRERILYVFQRLEEQAATPDFRGCPFVNTAIEMKDPRHPARLVARDFKQQLTAYFERQAALGGARDPQTLAAQLTVIFDGLAVRSVMLAAGLEGLSVRTASTLLDAAGVPS
jgi:AcrR family transcriptional regulator